MELKAEPKDTRSNIEKAREAKRLKAQKRKEEAAAHEGNGMLMEPAFEVDRFYEMMNALTVDYLNKNFTEQPIRELCLAIRDTLDRCNKRLQQCENQRTAMLCDHCHKVLPGGRFAGEIVIRDELTNELKALRACSEGCYREISRIANERRQRHQGSIRGTVAL